jgi:phosphoribosylglycinamide formyltransferase 1
MEKKSYKLGILASGRGSNLSSIMDSIDRKELHAEIAIVLSNKKEAPALKKCQDRGIPSLFLDPKSYAEKSQYDLALVKELQARSVDLICLAGYMKLLSSEFISAFRGKIVNIHPSLLPSFPGLNAQKQALDYGVKFSGCTVHYVDEGVDTGPVIMQSVVPIYDNDNEEELNRRILEQEHILYSKALQAIIEGRIRLEGRRTVQKQESL